MRHLISALLIFISTACCAQQFMTRDGHVHFFSSTPIEDIEADNHQMSGLLDASTGEFAFQVQMRAFHFEKALMEEHFNENYVESESHPSATFQGTIEPWDPDLKNGEPHDVVAKGTFECHGIAQDQEIRGKISWSDEAWRIEAEFEVALADHGIDVPAVVRDNIAERIDVDVHATLLPR